MQGMFGASVSESYLLIKSLINIERTVNLCVITKKSTHTYTGTVCQAWLKYTSMLHTQAGPVHAAGRGGGMDR